MADNETRIAERNEAQRPRETANTASKCGGCAVVYHADWLLPVTSNISNIGVAAMSHLNLNLDQKIRLFQPDVGWLRELLVGSISDTVSVPDGANKPKFG